MLSLIQLELFCCFSRRDELVHGGFFSGVFWGLFLFGWVLISL